MSEPEASQVFCELCTAILSKAISTEEADGDGQSFETIHISHVAGTTEYPDLIYTLNPLTNPIFSHAIPVEDLSQAFQDAITITRRLAIKYGLRHIWIDSLCILQDSKQEWVEEAPRMAEIYGNCWFNIAATAGGGLSSRPAGMFSQRDSGNIEPIRTIIPVSGDTDYTIFDDERWSDFVKSSPLNTRAWVCQERLLSPRILHFGVDEVFWECSLGRASETFPGGEPAVDMIESEANERPVRAMNEDYKLSLGPHSSYEDPLTQNFQSKLKGIDYLAGLWRTSLERQLLWKVHGTGHTKQSTKYRAPSWCWSSIDGPILTGAGEKNGEILLKVLEANVRVEGASPFGDASSGLLRLEGRILKGRLASDTFYFPGLRLFFDESLDKVAYHPDETVTPILKDETELYCMLISLKHIEIDLEEGTLEDMEGEKHHGDITTEAEVEEEGEEEEEEEEGVRLVLQGLVLKPLGSVRGQYQRVGIFETVIPNERDHIGESITAAGNR